MVPKQSRLLVMNLLRGAGLNAPKVRLAKALPGVADVDAVLGDFTEADFDGYAMQQPAWGAPALDGGFVAQMVTGVVTFTAGAMIAAPQTIYAVYVTLPDPTAAGAETLLYCEYITPTVTLVNPGEVFSKIMKLSDTNF